MVGLGPCAITIPAKVHIGYECDGGMRAMSQHHPSQGPHRIWSTIGVVVARSGWSAIGKFIELLPLIPIGYNEYDMHVMAF